MVINGSLLVLIASLYQFVFAFFVIITVVVCAVTHFTEEHSEMDETIDLATYLIVENVLPLLKLTMILMSIFFIIYVAVDQS